jgi:hypothetical protein
MWPTPHKSIDRQLISSCRKRDLIALTEYIKGTLTSSQVAIPHNAFCIKQRASPDPPFLQSGFYIQGTAVSVFLDMMREYDSSCMVTQHVTWYPVHHRLASAASGKNVEFVFVEHGGSSSAKRALEKLEKRLKGNAVWVRNKLV